MFALKASCCLKCRWIWYHEYDVESWSVWKNRNLEPTKILKYAILTIIQKPTRYSKLFFDTNKFIVSFKQVHQNYVYASRLARELNDVPQIFKSLVSFSNNNHNVMLVLVLGFCNIVQIRISWAHTRKDQRICAQIDYGRSVDRSIGCALYSLFVASSRCAGGTTRCHRQNANAGAKSACCAWFARSFDNNGVVFVPDAIDLDAWQKLCMVGTAATSAGIYWSGEIICNAPCVGAYYSSLWSFARNI